VVQLKKLIMITLTKFIIGLILSIMLMSCKFNSKFSGVVFAESDPIINQVETSAESGAGEYIPIFEKI
jgi:hypothetical protein